MIRLALLLFILFSLPGFGQPQLSTRSKKAIEFYNQADNYRVRGQFSQAISLLNQAIEKDDEFVEAYYRLGIVYMSLKDYPRAIQQLEKGLSLTDDPRKQKVFWFDLGESYFNMGDYANAEINITNYLKAEVSHRQNIARAKVLLQSIQFARDNQKNTSGYKISKLSNVVNSFVLQYFPVLTADQQEMIFTRRLGGGPNDDEDLVISRKNAHGKWGTPEAISKNINTQLNEGTCTISADGRKLIFTSCAGRDGLGSCDLFETRKVGGEWTKPKNLGPMVNSAEWESQPSLSADGRTLYFVSDRRGGHGRRDIWVSALNDHGQWTRARNIGKPINTAFDEISPFIHVNNRTLYFASNGLTGFGGYDLFYVEKDTPQWSEPKNIGAPINTHEDQFSLFITADGKKGYYSHEEVRDAGYSVSFIYEIEIPEDQQIRFRSNYVKGVVRDKDTKEPLLAQIELINLQDNNAESIVESDSVSGQYLIVLTQGADYALYVSKPGYLFQSVHFNYSEVKNFEPIILDVDLSKVKEGTMAVLENIFFDVDKYELKEKSMTELSKIVRFLRENPLTRVEISGHTDNSGAAGYNQQLSEKRAQSVYQHLIQQGIDGKRLSVVGYGSSRPMAENESEAGRQKNRRIEFKIVR